MRITKLSHKQGATQKNMDDREKIKSILTKESTAESINENFDYLLTVIPEIKHMIGFLKEIMQEKMHDERH